MNRRTFLRSLGKGIAGTALALHVSPNLIAAIAPKETGRFVACEMLRQAFNRYAERVGEPPSCIYADTQLYEQVESELVVHFRFTGRPDGPSARILAFKGAKLIDTGRPGWTFQMLRVA